MSRAAPAAAEGSSCLVQAQPINEAPDNTSSPLDKRRMSLTLCCSADRCNVFAAPRVTAVRTRVNSDFVLHMLHCNALVTCFLCMRSTRKKRGESVASRADRSLSRVPDRRAVALRRRIRDLQNDAAGLRFVVRLPDGELLLLRTRPAKPQQYSHRDLRALHGPFCWSGRHAAREGMLAAACPHCADAIRATKWRSP